MYKRQLVKAAESEAVEAHKAEDEAERAKLENALGMGAKGKGSAKALGGAASSIKALEEEQKKRGTRRKRDMFDLVLVDLAGVYRDAMMLQSGADLPLIHPDYEGLARDCRACCPGGPRRLPGGDRAMPPAPHTAGTADSGVQRHAGPPAPCVQRVLTCGFRAPRGLRYTPSTEQHCCPATICLLYTSDAADE